MKFLQHLDPGMINISWGVADGEDPEESAISILR